MADTDEAATNSPPLEPEPEPEPASAEPTAEVPAAEAEPAADSEDGDEEPPPPFPGAAAANAMPPPQEAAEQMSEVITHGPAPTETSGDGAAAGVIEAAATDPQDDDETSEDDDDDAPVPAYEPKAAVDEESGGLGALLNSLDGVLDDVVSPQKKQMDDMEAPKESRMKKLANEVGTSLKVAKATVEKKAAKAKTGVKEAIDRRAEEKRKKELEKLGPLPEGWEEGETEEGEIFYIDHENGVTSWEHPAALSLEKHRQLIAAAKGLAPGGDRPEAAPEPIKVSQTSKAEARQSRSGSIWRRKKKTDDNEAGDKPRSRTMTNRMSIFRKTPKDDREVKVLVGGWFIKKGKSKAREDHQRRWIELVDVPHPSMPYYVEFDEELAVAKFRKGAIDLSKGFKFKVEERTLFIETPGRVWQLEAENIGVYMPEWTKQLDAIQKVHDIELDPDVNVGSSVAVMSVDAEVLLAGWFLKKQKYATVKYGEQIDRTRRRYFQLIGGAAPAIHYFAKCKHGIATNHRGSLLLTDGFHVEANKLDKTELVLRAPVVDGKESERKWEMKADVGFENGDLTQTSEWLEKLQSLRQSLNIDWEPEQEEVVQVEQGVYQGWFRKKGKGGAMVDDYHKRYFMYDTSTDEISYYAGVKDSGEPKNHKGTIHLADGCVVERSKSTLFITTQELDKKGKKVDRKWILKAEVSANGEKQAAGWEEALLKRSNSSGGTAESADVPKTATSAPVAAAAEPKDVAPASGNISPPARPTPPTRPPQPQTAATTTGADSEDSGPDSEGEDDSDDGMSDEDGKAAAGDAIEAPTTAE